MLRVLYSCESQNTLSGQLKAHCDKNPLRQAFAIPMATSSYKLGTNRHKDARDLIALLTSDELSGGLALFSQFIRARADNADRLDPTSLESEIKKTFRVEQRSSASSDKSSSATCRA